MSVWHWDVGFRWWIYTSWVEQCALHSRDSATMKRICLLTMAMQIVTCFTTGNVTYYCFNKFIQTLYWEGQHLGTKSAARFSMYRRVQWDPALCSERLKHGASKSYGMRYLLDRLVGLVVTMSDYWSWGRGFDPRYFHNFKMWIRSGTGSTQPREDN